MNSIEFGNRYLESGGDIAGCNQVDNLTTAITLSMLGVEHPDARRIVTHTTTKSAMHVLESAIRHEGKDLDYLKGEYVPASSGGIGNPTFKVLTYAMRGLWAQNHAKLRADGPVTPNDAKAMSFAFGDLRGIGADLLWRRGRLIKSQFNSSVLDYALDREHPSAIARNQIEGMINEFDAALLLGGIALQKELIVVPSPPIFERQGKNESDFLVIDPKESAVAGVQVKLSKPEIKSRECNNSNSDSSGVVYISAMKDLGNVRTLYVPDKISDKYWRNKKSPNITVPYAGLVVSMCNKYYKWDSPQANIAPSQNKPFNAYIIPKRVQAKKLSRVQQENLYESYERKAEYIWSKIEPVLYSD